MTTDDYIRLALPADAEYGRLARIAAAGLALRLGFTYREIEDLRLAVDEAVIFLLRHDRRDGTLTVEFEPSPDQLVVDVRASGEADDEAGAGGDPAPDDPGDQERFARIVADVVDAFDVDDTGSHIRLVKSHTPVD